MAGSTLGTTWKITTWGESHGKAIGVVGTNLRMDDLTKQMASVKIYETGYISLIHKDGTVLYNPNKELKNMHSYNNGELENVIQEINENEKKTDIVYYELNGKEKVLSPSFEMIENVRNIYDLICNAQKNSESFSTRFGS